MRSVTLTLLSIVLVAGVCLAESEAQAEETIKTLMEALNNGGALELDGTLVHAVRILPDLYAANDYEPIWTNPASVGSLLAGIEALADDGLNPADYHYQTLASFGTEKPGDPLTMAKRDVLLTDAYFVMLYHLSYGKADPNRLDQDWNLNAIFGEYDPGDEPTQKELFALIIAAAAENDVDKLIDLSRPRFPVYHKMRDGYIFFRGLDQAGGWPTVPSGPTLREGDRDPRVPTLRQRLSMTRDYTGEDSTSDLLDADLATAVAGFQKRHGLAADGVVGKQTLATMNVTAAERAQQIRVNLERARWVLQLDFGDDAVIVNIASYDVWLFRENLRIWHARVQVGKPFTRTPVFADAIAYLEFNPTWTVPLSIANRSILPKVKQDSGYLATRDMVLLDGKGGTIDPATIDWASVTSMPYTVRQNPGPQNALGRVKFIFPNKHAVYLHDTPSRQHFSRDARAFSSGCIRVENPLELATLLLDDQAGWSREEVDAVVESGKRTVVNLTEKLPVLLLYWTAYSMDEGVMRFREDLYGRDAAVLELLDGPVVAQGRHLR